VTEVQTTSRNDSGKVPAASSWSQNTSWEKEGDHFWTYRFTRAYTPEGAKTPQSSDTFSQRHAQAVGVLMSKAIQFRQQHDATDWVRSCMQQ